MKFKDLVASRDGTLSLTKLAACTFHFQMAVWVAYDTYTRGLNIDVWMVYGGFAVGHAAYDKTAATVSAFKNKKLDVEAAK